MLPSSFVEKAQLPVRWQEKDLQDYLADKLRQRGYRVETEVKANGGRADIVSNWQGGTIVEVKKYLDRNSIYQAFGQLNLYGLNNTHKLVVMGFLTVNAEDQQSAFTTASMIEQHPRVQVVFVNLEKEWQPAGGKSVFAVPRLFSFPKFKLPEFRDWKWWVAIAKTNPLVLIAIATILFIYLQPITPITKKHFHHRNSMTLSRRQK